MPESHTSRRARVAAERDLRKRKLPKPRLRVGDPRRGMAAVGVLALAISYALPAYAIEGTTPVSAQGALVESQQIEVSASAASNNVRRDSYLVTRTTLEGYQPFAHTAATFSNNPDSAWQWPFSVGVPITSGFGYRECAGCGSNHQGLDMNPGEGTPIQAIGDGVVIDTGNPNGTFGVYAIIQHEFNGQRFTSLYAHMLQGSLALQVGDVVTRGSLVGQVGNTGQSTGAHLHFGIYLDGTTAIDPYAFMKQLVGS